MGVDSVTTNHADYLQKLSKPIWILVSLNEIESQIIDYIDLILLNIVKNCSLYVCVCVCPQFNFTWYYFRNLSNSVVCG